jgi:hypothetical protein
MSGVTQFGAVNTITTDSGTGTPLLGNINLVGSGSITVSASGDTVTVSGSGGGSGISQIDGDTGSATDSTITITGGTSGAAFTATSSDITLSFNSLALPTSTSSSTGVITLGASRFMHNYGALNDNNTFVGKDSGTFSLTSGSSTNNTSLGANTLNDLTTGDFNTCLGSGSGSGFTVSSNNVAVGYNSLPSCTGEENIAIGSNAGSPLGEASFNVLIGHNAGTALGGSAGSNILIGHGVTGESGDFNTIRIGREGDGGQDYCYLAGVYNQAANLDNTQGVVLMDDATLMGSLNPSSNGQLLIAAAGAPLAWSTLTPGSGINITNAANSVTIAVAQDGMPVVEVTSGPFDMSNNTTYLANFSSLDQFNMPTTAAVGDVIRVTQKNNSVGFDIVAGPSQIIHVGNNSTSPGGGMLTAGNWASVTMRCVVADTEWVAESFINMTAS